jgi:hypothetical protein
VVSAGLGPSFQPMLLASVLCGLQGPHGLDIVNVTKRKYGFIGSKFSGVIDHAFTVKISTIKLRLDNLNYFKIILNIKNLKLNSKN